MQIWKYTNTYVGKYINVRNVKEYVKKEYTYIYIKNYIYI